MDRLIVERKLDSLQRCLTRLAEKRPESPEALAEDVDLQDVLVLNLSRAVQICVDLAAQLLAGRKGPDRMPPRGKNCQELTKSVSSDEPRALRTFRKIMF